MSDPETTTVGELAELSRCF